MKTLGLRENRGGEEGQPSRSGPDRIGLELVARRRWRRRPEWKREEAPESSGETGPERRTTAAGVGDAGRSGAGTEAAAWCRWWGAGGRRRLAATGSGGGSTRWRIRQRRRREFRGGEAARVSGGAGGSLGPSAFKGRSGCGVRVGHGPLGR